MRGFRLTFRSKVVF